MKWTLPASCDPCVQLKHAILQARVTCTWITPPRYGFDGRTCPGATIFARHSASVIAPPQRLDVGGQPGPGGPPVVEALRLFGEMPLPPRVPVVQHLLEYA